LFALLLAPLILGSLASCQRKTEGTMAVTVIGQPPKVVDPSSGPLTTSEAVLLGQVAQGLVTFDASGNIVAGLAERWNLSDDGLSYIFRIASAEWPDGRKVTAQQVARILKAEIGAHSRDPLKSSLGAIEDVVAMTDRVIEIQLIAPRPNLLPILAQPEFAIVRDRQGTGPFQIAESTQSGQLLRREIESADDETVRREELLLKTEPARQAVAGFAAGTADLVLGGTFTDLPYALAPKLPRSSLRFDPASGLFGLAPAKTDGPAADPDIRRLLSAALDRDAIVARLAVPGLAGRMTLLEPGLDGGIAPVVPAWLSSPVAERQAALAAEAERRFGKANPAVVKLALPDGPGSEQLFAEIIRDWAAIGVSAVRVDKPADADFVLVDEVAPSSSPAWFARRFHCQAAKPCDPAIDTLLMAARQAVVPAQRYAFIAQAAGKIDEAQLFIPITAPIRWSLVGRRVVGFSGNRYARHTLTGLDQKAGTEQ
jgi:peptide/nickel transport system substrate-binding protein